eukprot:6531979-Prymnesium_polylepis.1
MAGVRSCADACRRDTFIPFRSQISAQTSASSFGFLFEEIACNPYYRYAGWTVPHQDKPNNFP